MTRHFELIKSNNDISVKTLFFIEFVKQHINTNLNYYYFFKGHLMFSYMKNKILTN